MCLLIGYEGGGIYPDRPATLAETAAVLCRLLQWMEVNSNAINKNHIARN